MNERLITIDTMVLLGRLALRFARTNRVTFHEDGKTPESDTDHTVMLGLVACEVASQLPRLNRGRVAELVLVHDLVEAYAGDTNSFDISDVDQAEKEAREDAALQQLRSEFMDAPWMLATISAYEAQEEPEARFVRYLDKAMPKICHLLNSCASIRSFGKTRDDLVRAHRSQLAHLNEQYPELAADLGSIMLDIMVASENAWPADPKNSSIRLDDGSVIQPPDHRGCISRWDGRGRCVAIYKPGTPTHNKWLKIFETEGK